MIERRGQAYHIRKEEATHLWLLLCLISLKDQMLLMELTIAHLETLGFESVTTEKVVPTKSANQEVDGFARSCLKYGTRKD